VSATTRLVSRAAGTSAAFHTRASAPRHCERSEAIQPRRSKKAVGAGMLSMWADGFAADAFGVRLPATRLTPARLQDSSRTFGRGLNWLAPRSR